jgi:hypothetical protein
MTPEERDRWTEEWMDAALEQRRNAEPRPGFEARILAKLTEARTHPARVPWLRSRAGRNYLVAVGVAAILIFVALYVLRPPHQEPKHIAHETPAAGGTTPSASSRSAISALPRAASHIANAQAGRERSNSGRTATPTAVAHATRRNGTQEPRLAQFPAPTPLSAQEQLLLRYVQQTPQEELIAVVRENQLLQEHSRQVEAETDSLRGPTQ